ncbi:MAG: transposase, partial [Bdellovibrionales bacterium]|nr:transposase [Bdellovibrionales bacterium]
MNYVLWGVIARAREQYDVSVCHFIFMGNHFHMLLVVRNPEDVSKFIGYVKTESAHAVNRFLNRSQRTVWQDGYDSPVVLTSESAKRYIAYIYLNPVRARLVASIKDYPGVSSWEMFVQKIESKKFKRLSRRALKPLSSPTLSIRQQRKLVSTFGKCEGSEHLFVLEPNAWMDCFSDTRDEDRNLLNDELLKTIRGDEAESERERKKNRQAVFGATALRQRSIISNHVPKKRSRRMICISSDKTLRGDFLRLFKALANSASSVYQAWKKGDRSQVMPVGMFSPPMPVLAS